jgi:hypothetical protein
MSLLNTSEFEIPKKFLRQWASPENKMNGNHIRKTKAKDAKRIKA